MSDFMVSFDLIPRFDLNLPRTAAANGLDLDCRILGFDIEVDSIPAMGCARLSD
jgi:hypothetical protein